VVGSGATDTPEAIPVITDRKMTIEPQ